MYLTMRTKVRWLKSLLLLISSLSVAYGSDDMLNFNNVWQLEPDKTLSIKSISYPNPSPGNTLTTWKISAPKNCVIQLTCFDLHMPRLWDDNCKGRQFVFSFSDGEVVRPHCGTHNNMKYQSYTNQLYIYQRIDVDGGALISCTVQAVVLEEKFRTTPPPLPKESDEEDSREHGGREGGKRTTCECGWANKLQENLRVIGGKETDIHEYPFNVGLTNKGGMMPFCGGSIITPYHVLTSAHCVVKNNAEDVEVMMGEHNWLKVNETTNSYKVVVSKMDLHPVYLADKKPSADIAVLTLSKGIKFNKFIGPVCLPNRELNLEGKYVKVIGWGRTMSMGKGSEYVKEVNVKVVPVDKCRYYFGGNHVNMQKPQLVCTYTKLKGIGLGDSGGPVVWLDPETNRYTLVGLPALVALYNDDDHKVPDMSTDVSTYLDWIHEKIEESTSSAFTESHPKETCSKKD